ncbi:MAG: S-layer homology domain-containing protein, partial [Sporomusa sp.]
KKMKLKRFIVGLLVVGMVLPGMCISAFAYSDVKDSDWYSGVVTYATDKGYFNGVGDDKFDPEGNMTRGMFVTALMNVAENTGMDATGSRSSSFTDVGSGDWFFDAVIWAADKSLVDGYGDGLFGPNDKITREQMATIMARFAEFMEITLNTNKTVSFTDSGEISDWAYDAVQLMASAGIIAGYETGAFGPADTLTRAQAATVIVRMMDPDWEDSIVDSTTYAAGTYKIGVDMPAGEYLITSGSSDSPTYMQVASDSSNSLDSTITNDNFYNRIYITVSEGQYLKFTAGTAILAKASSAYSATGGLYPSGMYLVGKDIPAGEYKISVEDGGIGLGYYEVCSDSLGVLDSIITNDNISSDTYQTLKEGQYIKRARCFIQA